MEKTSKIPTVEDFVVTLYTRAGFDSISETFDDIANIEDFCNVHNINLDDYGEFVYNNLLDYYYKNENFILATNPNINLRTGKIAVIDENYVKYIKENKLKHDNTSVLKYAMSLSQKELKELFNRNNLTEGYLLYYLPISFISDVKEKISTVLPLSTIKKIKSFFACFANTSDICVFNKIMMIDDCERFSSAITIAAKDFFNNNNRDFSNQLGIPDEFILSKENVEVFLIPIVIRTRNFSPIINLDQDRDSIRFFENYNVYSHAIENDLLDALDELNDPNDNEVNKLFIDYAKDHISEQKEFANLIKNNKYSCYHMDSLYIPTFNSKYIFSDFNNDKNKMYFQTLSTPETVASDVVEYINSMLDLFSIINDDDE